MKPHHCQRKQGAKETIQPAACRRCVCWTNHQDKRWELRRRPKETSEQVVISAPFQGVVHVDRYGKLVSSLCIRRMECKTLLLGWAQKEQRTREDKTHTDFLKMFYGHCSVLFSQSLLLFVCSFFTTTCGRVVAMSEEVLAAVCSPTQASWFAFPAQANQALHPSGVVMHRSWKGVGLLCNSLYMPNTYSNCLHNIS